MSVRKKKSQDKTIHNNQKNFVNRKCFNQSLVTENVLIRLRHHASWIQVQDNNKRVKLRLLIHRPHGFLLMVHKEIKSRCLNICFNFSTFYQSNSLFHVHNSTYPGLMRYFKQLHKPMTPSAVLHIINIEKYRVVINCHISVVCN